jgi:hypothetical protein
MLHSIAAAMLLGAAACADLGGPEVLTDDVVSEDMAISSGEAVASAVGELIGNEVFSGLAGAAPAGAPAAPEEIEISRSRTCYDEDGNEQQQCNNLTTASIRIQWTVDGTKETQHLSASIHHTHDATISGLLGEETSRTHNGIGTSDDTVTITRENLTKTVAESSVDSVRNVVFNLPRSTNPWPVSGSIVRNVSATITVSGPREETRTVSRRIEVTFPPDSQGNVSIQVGDVTCTLNLVTRAVTSCSS